MKVASIAIAATLLLGTAAYAADNGASGTTRSGTMDKTGANDAGSGASPGSKGSGESTGGTSRSGTSNSTGANDAGSGSSPGASGAGKPTTR